MNSISSSLTAKSIIATARMLRSARKEVFLIVEGDDDIALFSHSLKLSRSNFLSCFGKERLMEVFRLVPAEGLDAGTVLIRDADCDGVKSQVREGVLLLTSDLYDFEMSLLPRRIFGRIFGEFMKTRASPELADDAFSKIIASASLIGALRFMSHRENINIDFKEYKLGFLDAKTLVVDPREMVRYFFSRSQKQGGDRSDVVQRLRTLIAEFRTYSDVASGKDFLRILSVALSKHYKCCNSLECSFETLARMFRMAVIQDDLRELTLYPLLAAHICESGFEWKGVPL